MQYRDQNTASSDQLPTHIMWIGLVFAAEITAFSDVLVKSKFVGGHTYSTLGNELTPYTSNRYVSVSNTLY